MLALLNALVSTDGQDVSSSSSRRLVEERCQISYVGISNLSTEFSSYDGKKDDKSGARHASPSMAPTL